MSMASADTGKGKTASLRRGSTTSSDSPRRRDVSARSVRRRSLIRERREALKSDGYSFVGYHGTNKTKARKLIKEGINFSLINLEGQRYPVFVGFYVTPSLECALRYAAVPPDGVAPEAHKPAIVAVYLPTALLSKIHVVPNMNPDEDPNLLPYLEDVGLHPDVTRAVLDGIPYGIGGPESAGGKDELMLGAQLVAKAAVLPTYYEDLFEIDPLLAQAYYRGLEPRRRVVDTEEVLPGSFRYARGADGGLVLVEARHEVEPVRSAHALAFFDGAACLPVETVGASLLS
jgi:hypothetical protein